MHSLGQRVPDEGQKVDSTAIEDVQLATAVLAKDRKATAEFVARYADSVYGYIHARLAPRRDQVEDLVQEVFLSAWENLGRYRGAGPLGAWVMGSPATKLRTITGSGCVHRNRSTILIGFQLFRRQLREIHEFLARPNKKSALERLPRASMTKQSTRVGTRRRHNWDRYETPR